MTAPVTWDAWPEPHKKFATALSLAVPNVPVPMAKILDLARGVVMAADRRPMAFDEAEGDPLSAVEKALLACESEVRKATTDELQRAKLLEQIKEYGRATNAAGRAGHKLGEDRRQSRDVTAGRDRRQAADARPSVLDKVFAGIPKPLRL